MRVEKINLLSDHDSGHDLGAFVRIPEARPTHRQPALRPQKKGVKFFLSRFLVLAFLFAASFGVGRFSLTPTVNYALAKLENVPILGKMSHLITSPNRELSGEG